MSHTFDTLPNINVKSTSDTTLNLQSLHGKKVVLYFYPKNNTPGCTIEGQNFRDNHEQFQKLNTVIFGISKDTLKSHEKFKAKHQLPFDLICDDDAKLCDIFSVINEKTLFGKLVKGIERSTFLFDESGKLHQSWRAVKVKGHVLEVLDSIKHMSDR